MLRPLAVIRNGKDDGLGQIIAPENFQDLGFREAGIVESDFENLRVTGGDQGAGNTRGAAAGEGNSLPQRQLWEARDDVFLGVALEFGGSAGRQRKLYEVHQVEVAQQAKADEARGSGMENQGALHGVAFQECLPRGDALNNLGGEILSG